VKFTIDGGLRSVRLELARETAEDAVAIRDISAAIVDCGGVVQVKSDGDDSIAIELPRPEDGKLLVGYWPNGWADEYTDENTGEAPIQWHHWLEVRPADPARWRGPVHGFVARMLVTTSQWFKDGEKPGEWRIINGPSVGYFGEHTSLAAGIAAVKRAYRRSLLLRDGPENK